MTIFTPSVFAAGDRGKALIVYGQYTEDEILGPGDIAIGKHLESLGFDVAYILAPESDENSWKGNDLVFIGESVMSAEVALKFQLAESFVICSEPGLFDEMLIGNYDTQYDSEPYLGTYSVVNDIINCGLKTFKGFTNDDVIPGFLLDLAPGLVVIVENENKSPAVSFLGKGLECTDGSKAFGNRAQFFCRRQDAVSFSAETWAVFDALVDYVLPLAIIEEEISLEQTETGAINEATVIKSPQTADTSIIISLAALSSVLIGIATYKKRK